MIIDNSQIFITILLTFASISGILSVGAFILGLKAWIAVKAMEKSTHTVTYAPIDKEIDKANEEWGTKQETLDKHRKMYREDLEEDFPELAPDEDDFQIHSF